MRVKGGTEINSDHCVPAAVVKEKSRQERSQPQNQRRHKKWKVLKSQEAVNVGERIKRSI